MNRLTILCVLVLVLGACESKSPSTSSDAASPATGPAADATTKTDAAESAVEVLPIEFDDKMFPGELPPGDQQGGFAFRDSAGENHVAFSREETETEAGKMATVLHVKHVAKKGDEVSEVRSYREVIENCEFDVVLEPKFGAWSVSDVDADGVGEATFAYTADCTSDISPNKHKVLMTEAGEKVGLRGVTSVEIAPGEVVGGEFDADDMPDEFREHADMVWEETSIGLRMR